MNEFAEFSFINQQNYINQIIEGIEKTNSVLVVGAPGVGKTTLAREFANQNPFSANNIYFYNRFTFGNDFDLIDKSVLGRNGINANKKSLLIIDGLDEIKDENTNKLISTIFKEGKKYGISTLATMRPQSVLPSIIANSSIINLDGFNREQVRILIEKSFKGELNALLEEDSYHDLINAIGNNPQGVYSILDLINKKSFSPRELENTLTKGLTYKNLNIIEGNQRIILPSEISSIERISLVNEGLIERVKSNPEIMFQMHPRKFEELVAEIFQKKGYNVVLTQETRDGGKDLIVTDKSMLGNLVFYVECKRYAKNNPISVNIVRELYGTVSRDRVTAGIAVTTSYFSEPAIEFAKTIQAQLSLIDYTELREQIANIKS